MNYVSARDGIPVPTKPYERAGRAEWVDCKCGLKHRPGAFHICMDLSADEPEVKQKPKPKPKKKARKTRRSSRDRAPWGGNECECGKPIDVRARQCRACMRAAYETPECGTPEKYQWHRRQAVKDPENHLWPLPKEDPCGCRAAQANRSRARKEQAA